MTANTSPIFPLTPKLTWSGNITAGTDTYDGTSGTTQLMQAGSNGALLRNIIAKPAGTNVDTLARFFINNNASVGTATNNFLFFDYPLVATAASATAPTTNVNINVNLWIPANYLVYVVLATAVSAGWNFGASYGDF